MALQVFLIHNLNRPLLTGPTILLSFVMRLPTDSLPQGISPVVKIVNKERPKASPFVFEVGQLRPSGQKTAMVGGNVTLLPLTLNFNRPRK